MKLISMTDFVLEQCENNKSCVQFENLCYNYANFLKQPLKLEMFVPCDGLGNILKENEKITCQYDFEVEQFSKENILFKGFSLLAMTKTIDEENTFISIKNKKDIRNKMFSSWFEKREIDNHSEEKTIEDLIKYNFDLTESAIKRIFG